MYPARVVILLGLTLGALFAPLFAMGSTGAYCERWKGRTFLAPARASDSPQCVSGCALNLVDVQGFTARYEVSGASCAKGGPKIAPSVFSQAPEVSAKTAPVGAPWRGAVRSVRPNGVVGEPIPPEIRYDPHLRLRR